MVDARVVEYGHACDGDTFTCRIDQHPAVFPRYIRVRIRGIDTHELVGFPGGGPNLGRLARAQLDGLLRGATDIWLRDIVADKYFRLLATVWVDGRNVGDEMIRIGAAVEYAQRKRTWRGAAYYRSMKRVQ